MPCRQPLLPACGITTVDAVNGWPTAGNLVRVTRWFMRQAAACCLTLSLWNEQQHAPQQVIAQLLDANGPLGSA